MDEESEARGSSHFPKEARPHRQTPRPPRAHCLCEATAFYLALETDSSSVAGSQLCALIDAGRPVRIIGRNNSWTQSLNK